MSQRIVIAAIALLFLAGAGYFFYNQNKTAGALTEIPRSVGQLPSSTPVIAQTTTSAALVSAVQEVTVEGGDLKFTPNKITVKEGEQVKLTFKNSAGRHNFVIDEFNVKTQIINSGFLETVEFVANKKGEFEFYCSVPGHRVAGMKGILVVE